MLHLHLPASPDEKRFLNAWDLAGTCGMKLCDGKGVDTHVGRVARLG
jgi:hypothetical protein